MTSFKWMARLYRVPLLASTLPCYPLQMLCACFFHYKGLNYLVIVEHYSNWPIVEWAHDKMKSLIHYLHQAFGTFGIRDELASVEGCEFIYSTIPGKLGSPRPIFLVSLCPPIMPLEKYQYAWKPPETRRALLQKYFWPPNKSYLSHSVCLKD